MNDRPAAPSLRARLAGPAAAPPGIIAIAVICTVMLPLSVVAAGWAPGAEALPLVCLLSLVCGAWIGRWRLPLWVCWLVSFLLGLALAALHAGFFQAHVQVTLVRVTTWGTDLLAGRVISDPALVRFWTALWTWWAGFSAAHGMASGRPGLEALLPTMASLAVHAVYTRQSLDYILMASFGLIILMAWAAQGRRQADWTARGVDYPAELGPEWMGSGLAVAGVACALAALLSVFASRTTIEWMRRTFDVPVSHVQQAASRLLGGIIPRPGLGGQDVLASLPTSRLVGSPPELTQQTVMWVWTNEPPPFLYGASSPGSNLIGWRGMTYAIYTGRGWSNPALTRRPLPSSPPAQATGNLVQRFEIVSLHGDTAFAGRQPIYGDAGLVGLYASEADWVGLRGTLAQYTVVSHAGESALRQPPPSISSTLYLQLPDTLPQRVRDLTAQVTAGASTPYDQAIRVEAFLRTYSYTLDLPPLPQGRDLVDYFLFDAPGGYCDYYASAMVVMLRAAGVPARLVSGYARGSYDLDRGAYRVIGADAHSWPEAYLAGAGWVEFEPTAGRPVPVRAQRAPGAETSAGQVRAAQVRAARVTALAWAAVGLALLAAAAASWAVRRERQMAALPAGELIPLLYEDLRQRAARLGVVVRPSDTPDEFVAAFGRAVERHAADAGRWRARLQAARPAAALIAQAYRAASYGPLKPGAAEARQALAAWRALRPVWILSFGLQANSWLTRARRRLARLTPSGLLL